MRRQSALNPDGERYVSPREAAQLLGVEIETLSYWRSHNQGPRWRKFGRRTIRYALSDLHVYADQMIVGRDSAPRKDKVCA